MNFKWKKNLNLKIQTQIAVPPNFQFCAFSIQHNMNPHSNNRTVNFVSWRVENTPLPPSQKKVNSITYLIKSKFK